jgi:CubicO group peptidase (beta-lactamase class C family)/septal ring factor EnvC (AmiA/AmiB activator)
MAFNIKSSLKADPAKTERKRVLFYAICTAVITFLVLSHNSHSFGATSQNDIDFSTLDLKWLSASPSLIGFDTEQLDSAVENIGRMNGIYSVLVIRNNYLVLERYFREGSRTKPHNLKSATKSVMAALTGIAIEKGYLRLDQPISDFLPHIKNLSDPRKSDITVLHLLTMTSGLEPTSYQAYNDLAMNGTDWVKTILDRPLVAAPGTKHHYSTGDTHLLSAVLTAATRMSTKGFAVKHLFDPLNISVKGWEIDPQGINQGGNNLSLIPMDMALFGQLYLDDGIYRNKRIIPKWWVDASTRPNYFGEHAVYGHYSYLWYSRPGGTNAYVAVGYGGQYIYVSLDKNCVVVITSTLESKGKKWERELFGYIQTGILGSVDPEQQQLLQVKHDTKSSPAFYQNSPASGSSGTGSKIALTVSGLNLRKGPSRTNAIIKLLDTGTVLEVQEQKGSWLKVVAGNNSGWVSAEYVRFVNPERFRFADQKPEAIRPVSIQQALDSASAPAVSTAPRSEALKKSQNLVAQLQNQLETSNRTRQILEEDLNNTRSKLHSEQQAVIRLESERKTLEKQLAALNNQSETQNTDLKEIQSSRDGLQAKLNALQEGLAEKQKNNERTLAEKKDLEDKLKETQSQIAELQKSRSRISKQETETRKKLEAELTAERTKLQEVEKQLQISKAGGEDINSELTKLNKELDKQQRAAADSEAERKALEIKIAGIQDQLDSQTETLSTVQSKRDALKNDLAENRKQNEELRENQRQLIANAAVTKKELEAELAAESTKLQEVEK